MGNIIEFLIEDTDTALNKDMILESGFCPWITDRIDEVNEESKKKLFEVFTMSLKEDFPALIRANGDHIVFKKGFRKAFTEKLIRLLRECMEEASAGSITYLADRLNEILDDSQNVWIYFEDSLYTLGQFLRDVVAEDETYYLGNAVSYH